MKNDIPAARLPLRHCPAAFCSLICKAFAALLFLGGFSPAALGGTTLDQYQAIVVAKDASPVVQAAAGDLQYYMQKIANRKIPLLHKLPAEGLSFIVGPGILPDQDAAIKNLPPEGWVLRSVKQGLLFGGNDTGPNPKYIFYHAVPMFLKNYAGVRWLWPGKTGEVIPVNPKLVIEKLDESGAPKLARRKIDFYFSRYNKPEIQEELKRWERNSFLGDQVQARFAHSWAGLFKEKDYEAHPEWFALVDGKRTRPTKKAMNWQLCLSNPEMRDAFYKRLEKRLSGHNIVSVSPNDGGGFCECPICKAYGSIGDLYWSFVADMATRLQKDHPNNGIGSFAYTFFREPPDKIDKLPSNICISMTTYAATHAAQPRKEAFLKFLKDWQSKGVRIMMREYWGMHYWQDLPILYPREISEEIKLAYKSGLMGAYGEGGKNWGTQAPNYYVLVNTMWDPDVKVDVLLNEFYECFGPAKKPVQAYYETLEKAVREQWSKHDPGTKWANIAPLLGLTFSAEVMAKASAYLDEADKLAQGDKKLQARLAFLRQGCDYTKVVAELFRIYNKLGIALFREETPVKRSFAQKKALLERAWDLGQKRIELLNQARDDFALDEGLYARYLETNSRGYHKEVCHMLGKSEDEIAVLHYVHPPDKKK